MLSWQKTGRKKCGLLCTDHSIFRIKPLFWGSLLAGANWLSTVLISRHWKFCIKSCSFDSFHVSKEKIYIHLLLNVSMMGIWEIKLKRQSNDFSTDRILNDKHDGQFLELHGNTGGSSGLTGKVPLHEYKQSEASILLHTAVRRVGKPGISQEFPVSCRLSHNDSYYQNSGNHFN